MVVELIFVGRNISTGIEIDFQQRNNLATSEDLVTSIGQDEWSNTDIVDEEGGGIPRRIESSVALTQDNQYSQDNGKDGREGIPQGAVRQLMKVTALSNIRLAETNVCGSNTSPTDETRDGSDTQKPDESIGGAVDLDNDTGETNDG